MKLWKTWAVAAFALAAMAAAASPAMKTVFDKTYEVKPESALGKASCAVCHASKTSFKKLNPYGTEIKKALAARKTKELTAEVLKSLETLDSDKDGVKNGDEIKGDKLPGDPKIK